MDSDYGIFLDGWGDHQDSLEEQRWWDEYEAAQEKWRAENPELAKAQDDEEDRKREQDRADVASYQKQLDLEESKAKANAKAKTKVKVKVKVKVKAQRKTEQKPVFSAPSGSVITSRNTILDPDGWETVVPRGATIRFDKPK